MPATGSAGSARSAVAADFDWFSPEVIRDPQKYDGLIREAGPVVFRRSTTCGRRAGTRRSS
jgi:hypothetical protein